MVFRGKSQEAPSSKDRVWLTLGDGMGTRSERARTQGAVRLFRTLVSAGLSSAAVLTACGPAEAPGVTVESVRIESAGWELAGTFTPSPTASPSPAVLLLHRAAGSRQEFDALAEALARRGVAALALDLRGHGESTNLGRFQEPYADHLHINAEAHEDVLAALGWLAARSDVDETRMAVVAASYSGELVGRALRVGPSHPTEGRPVRPVAYVMLSPGNFSEESVLAARESDARWLFVRSVEESPVALPHIDTLFTLLEGRAPRLERRTMAGAGHATRLFETRPDLPEELADWLVASLGEPDA